MVDHFYSHFSEPYNDHPQLDGVPFRALLEEDNASLTTHFLLTDIGRALGLCESNKSPDPDGFNLSFLRGFCPSSKMI